MNTDLIKKAKNNFEKYLCNLMNNAVFEKTIENVRKHRDIKLVAKERKRNYGMIMKLQYDYVKPRFGTSNYQLDRPLPEGKNKKEIGLMKNELGRKIIIKCVGLRAKTCSYLIDDSSEDKKAKGTKQCVSKRKLKFENYKISLEGTQLENKINYLKKIKLTKRVCFVKKENIKNS